MPGVQEVLCAVQRYTSAFVGEWKLVYESKTSIEAAEIKFMRRLHYRENGHSVQFHVPGALTEHTAFGTHFKGSWVEPTVGVDPVEKSHLADLLDLPVRNQPHRDFPTSKWRY